MEVADIVVQTSLWEGQPLTIQGGPACRRCDRGHDVGGTAVTARGGAVLVVPQAQAIAEALRTLLSDPRRPAPAPLSARKRRPDAFPGSRTWRPSCVRRSLTCTEPPCPER